MTRYRAYHDDPREARDRIYGAATGSRDGRQMLATVVLAVSVFFLVGSVSARQVTSPGPARNILESGLAVTTEIERVIAEDHDALRQLVEGSSASTFALPDYPLDVVLSRDEILRSSDDELRTMVLERSSGLVYANGVDSFDRTGDQSFDRLSKQGLLELGVSQISEDNHSRANLLSALFLAITAVAACFVLLTNEGWKRLRALGSATAIGAAPGIIIVGLTWLVVDRVGGSDPFASGLRHIIQTTLEGPLRNYGVAATLGLSLAITGVVAGIVDRRCDAPVASEPIEDR